MRVRMSYLKENKGKALTMSLKYVEQRVKDALVQSGGNAARARDHIIKWAQSDPELLLALTEHHLTGIVAYHIERVASGRASKPKARPPEKPKAKVDPGEKFGLEILKAVANSSSAIFGLESGAPPQKRAKASQQHIDALKAMASRTTKSKKK